MRRAARTVLACAVLGLPLPAAAEAATPTQTMLREINAYRAKKGLRGLKVSRSLNRAAYGHAFSMIRYDYFAHASDLRRGGRFRLFGEIIEIHAGGRPAVRTALRRWIHSPGHHRLLLHRAFQHFGAGWKAGRMRGRARVVWVVRFGGR